MTRLNKFIAEAGVASRRKADELIAHGRIEVNGKIVDEPGFKVDPTVDKITYDGAPIKIKQKVYFLLNKPKGVITTTDDERKRVTVCDLIKTREKIFPVGRLDYNTTGILLLTNDGDFANFILHPSRKIPRKYNVILDRPLSQDDEKKLLKGIMMDGRHSKFHELTMTGHGGKTLTVVTQEGRNHFVKNMFKVISYTVVQLNRESFGPFDVEGIPQGSYRLVSPTEIDDVYKKYQK